MSLDNLESVSVLYGRDCVMYAPRRQQLQSSNNTPDNSFRIVCGEHASHGLEASEGKRQRLGGQQQCMAPSRSPVKAIVMVWG